MLTILLVPPPEDTALLADEAGGTMPTMYLDSVAGAQRPCPVCGAPTRWWSAPTDQHDSCYICTADAGHAFPQSAVTVMGWRMGRHRDAPRALLLVLDGAPVAMGCDRALRVAIPAYKARRNAVRTKIEDRARAIYTTLPGTSQYPWIEGGNSFAQDDARDLARREMSDDELAQDGSLGVIMGPTYAIEDALWVARLYADTRPGARVVLLRDGRGA